MNDITGLAALGLVLPSAGYIVGSLVFGIAGYATYRRGRKAERPALTWSGVALMVYPYAVPQTWLLWLIGVILCGWVYTKWD